MPEEPAPDCLSRRCEALDQLVRELSAMSHHRCCPDCPVATEPGVRVMRDFWNLLRNDPNSTLPYNACLPTCRHVTAPGMEMLCEFCKFAQKDPDLNPPQFRQCLCPSAQSSHSSVPFIPQRVTCYMAEGGVSCSQRRNELEDPNKEGLGKVLENLKKAAVFDRDCNKKLKELLAAEKHLRGQIVQLEQREKDGIRLLKEADEMWNSMENSYKEKITQSMERQKNLVKEVQQIEKSAAKWQKNKKDLEQQLQIIKKCQIEMALKINEKSNDLKSIDMEIASFEKKAENTKKEILAVQKAITNKKKSAEAKFVKLNQEAEKIEKNIKEEKKIKKNKERQGKQFVKEARDDLQNMCKLMLQKKLEYEDLKAEKDALIEEMNILKDTCDNCKERCKQKQLNLGEEIRKVDIEIHNFKVQCVRCNQCTDTTDMRQFCVDCPRCINKRQCLITESNECHIDLKEDCVCQMVKNKFLNNVFDNMYSILDKQIKSDAGKAVAEDVLECLKKSRNGKLDDRTRRSVHDFVLSVFKNNLNLTIVGGAVKTRCEMDKTTYNQLMLCLKNVKSTPPPKTEQGTDVKRDPCPRWGEPGECNCPKGPKNCICTKKAPPKPNGPSTCPTGKEPGEVIKCPHKIDQVCGPACGAAPKDNHPIAKDKDTTEAAGPNKVGTEVSTWHDIKWRPDPCAGPSCTYGKNMRAAQCVLGPEHLPTFRRSATSAHVSILYDQGGCKCGYNLVNSCLSPKDERTVPRQKMFEEVMGKYMEVSPIEKVSKSTSLLHLGEISGVRLNISRSIFSTNIFRMDKFSDDSTRHIIENIWINNSRLTGNNDKIIVFPDLEDKVLSVTFPEFTTEISSQVMSSEFYDCDRNLNNTNCIHNDGMQLTNKSGINYQTMTECKDSENALSMYHSCSNDQSEYSKGDLLTEEQRLKFLQSYKKDIAKFIRYVNTFNPRVKRLDIELESLGDDIYGDRIKEEESSKKTHYNKTVKYHKRPKSANIPHIPERLVDNNVHVVVKQNKTIEKIFKNLKANNEKQLKLIQHLLNKNT